MNSFGCKKCDNYHKKAHEYCSVDANHYRQQRDNLRRENNKLQRQLRDFTAGNPPQMVYFRGMDYSYGYDKSNQYNKGYTDAIEYMRKERAKKTTPRSSELIVAYRVWIYNEGRLQSTYKTDFFWPFRKALQRDIYNDAGIHAVKDYKNCIQLINQYCGGGPSVYDPAGLTSRKTGVAGAVYLWGEVKEHEIGYLAEYCYPKELFVGDDADPMMVMELEKNYGVPVNLRSELSVKSLDDALYPNINANSITLYSYGLSPSPYFYPGTIISTPSVP